VTLDDESETGTLTAWRLMAEHWPIQSMKIWLISTRHRKRATEGRKRSPSCLVPGSGRSPTISQSNTSTLVLDIRQIERQATTSLSIDPDRDRMIGYCHDAFVTVVDEDEWPSRRGSLDGNSGRTQNDSTSSAFAPDGYFLTATGVDAPRNLYPWIWGAGA